MRNLKKFLALVLATLMVVSAAATVSAYAVFDDVEDENQYAEAIGRLVEYNITNGKADGIFGVDDNVERYQMALFMARALNINETDWQSGMAIFDDVEEWYGAIAYAYMNGIVTGIGNNQFAPHAGIRYQDALIMALRALGYTVDVSGDPYWLAAYQQAIEIGLTNNVAVTKGDKTLTRAETAQLICNMLDATPADGGLTIAQKNFGAELPAEPEPVKTVDTFVITATSKQAFGGSSDKVANEAYVTLQALNEDGTLGDGFYKSFASLGFDEDITPDDVIGYSVGLVNYNAKDNSFEEAIPNTAKVVLTTDADVKVDGNKLTVDGKVYYLVNKYTGNELKNEIIVKDENGTISSNSLDNVNKFYYNAAGDIVSPDGKTVLAVKASATGANGQTLYKLASADVNASRLYTVAELLNVDEVKTAYKSVTSADKYTDVKELSGNKQIILFKDDADEYYDRAIVSTVYMSVYNNMDGKKINIASNAFTTSTEGVSINYKTSKGVEKLVKGDVFTYTYNKQSNTINVLEVLPEKNGTIEKINITGDSAAKYTLTISNAEDGVKAYNFASTNKDGFGASFAEANADKLTGNDTIGNVKSTPAIKLVNWAKFNTTGSMGATVKYYVYNGYIIYAESYDVEETFNLVAIKSVNTIDNDGNIVADVYVDGKLVQDAVISEVIDSKTDKTVVLADLNSIRWTAVTNEYIKTENKIFKGIPLEDGSYRLGVELEDTRIATTAKKSGGFGLSVVTIDKIDDAVDNRTNGAIAFLDGVTENGDKYYRLRTDKNTVYYFINFDTEGNPKLKVATGSAEDSIIYTDASTSIYADCIGNATRKSADGKVTYSTAGVATKIVVYNYVSLEGFGIAATGDAIVYIPAGLATINKYEINTAEEFGLGSNYEGAYYKYADAGINMSDGNKVTLYSAKLLKAGNAYKVDKSGVVFGDPIEITNDDYFDSKLVAKSDIITDDRYLYIDMVGTPIDVDDKIATIYGQDMNATKVDPKKNDKAKDLIAKDKSATIYYLAKAGNAIDLKDGIFVAIFDMSEAPDPDKVTVNAKWTYTEGTTTNIAAVVDDLSVTNTAMSGKVYLPTSDANGTQYILFPASYGKEVAVSGKKLNLSAFAVSDVTLEKANGTVVTVDSEKTLTLKDNVITFAIADEKVPSDWGTTENKFEAGNYYIKIALTVPGNAAASVVVTIPVTVK